PGRGIAEEERRQGVGIAVVGVQGIRARELAIVVEISARLVRVEVLHSDLAIRRAELGRVPAPELGYRRVRVPGVVRDVVDGTLAKYVAFVFRAVRADLEVGELLHRDLADEVRREAEGSRVESGDGHAVIGEVRVTEANVGDRRRVRRDRVV